MMLYIEFGRSVVYKELDVWMMGDFFQCILMFSDTVDALDDFS